MNRSIYVALLTRDGLARSGRVTQFADALRYRHQLTPILETQPLQIFGDPAAAHVMLMRSGGVVWGHLFDRTTGSRLSAASSASLANGEAEDLLERYWGGYIAIRPRGDAIEVLRDPSGAVACYHADIDGTQVVTSRPDLLAHHFPSSFSVDWTIIAQALVYRDLRPARTALRGINEVLPGVALQVAGGRVSSRCAWSPWRFADRNAQITDIGDAIRRVDNATTGTLASWGECFERPIVEISGGLDSAIVAAGVRAARPHAHCVTFGPWPGDADERPYARAVAAHLALALEELTLAAEAVDITRSDAGHLPRPCARAFSQALDRPIQDVARRIGADGFLGGAGGDNVFCHLQSALPLLDRTYSEGIGRGTLQTAADIAMLSRTDTWQVLRVAAQRWMRPATRLPNPKTNRFVTRAARESLPWPADNPWLEAPADALPGKRRHVWALIGIQNHLEGYGREAHAPYISPLMSQPMLEACLTIPSWLWCTGGNNRAIAREAFRDRLPPEIIDRRTKGAFDGFVAKVIEKNRVVLREMLLDGALVREGIIDPLAVGEFLNLELPARDGLGEFAALADVEAWVGGWQRGSGSGTHS